MLKFDVTSLSNHVEIEVGMPWEKKKFIVHKDILTHHCPYIRDVCDTGEDRIQLYWTRPETFSSYLRCISTEHIPTAEMVKEIAKHGYDTLFKVYALSYRLQDFTTANLIVDEVLQVYKETKEIPRGRSVKWARSESPLHRLLVDLDMRDGNESDFRSDRDQLPEAFFRDFFIRYGEIIPRDRSRTVSEALGLRLSFQGRCYYHFHNEKHLPCTDADATTEHAIEQTATEPGESLMDLD